MRQGRGAGTPAAWEFLPPGLPAGECSLRGEGRIRTCVGPWTRPLCWSPISRSGHLSWLVARRGQDSNLRGSVDPTVVLVPDKPLRAPLLEFVPVSRPALEKYCASPR